MFWLLCRFGVAVLLPIQAEAATADLIPSGDTTLSENYASNNFGAMTFLNSGTTQNLTKNRGLLRFDLGGEVPALSRITNAWLTVEVLKQPADGYAFADFGLHRLLRSWGEGTKQTPPATPGSGTGAPAGTNEACWLTPLAFSTNLWTGSGAQGDFLLGSSSTTTIYGIGDSPYTFFATPAMLEDLQMWLDNPASNFGWALVCEDETLLFTARRFGSRENEQFAPVLHLEFEPPPAFNSVRLEQGQVVLGFSQAKGRGYELQTREAADAGWRVLGAYPAAPQPASISITNRPLAASQLYRLRFAN